MKKLFNIEFVYIVLLLIFTFGFLFSMWAEKFVWAIVSIVLLGGLYLKVSEYIKEQTEK